MAIKLITTQYVKLSWLTPGTYNPLSSHGPVANWYRRLQVERAAAALIRKHDIVTNDHLKVAVGEDNARAARQSLINAGYLDRNGKVNRQVFERDRALSRLPLEIHNVRGQVDDKADEIRNEERRAIAQVLDRLLTARRTINVYDAVSTPSISTEAALLRQQGICQIQLSDSATRTLLPRFTIVDADEHTLGTLETEAPTIDNLAVLLRTPRSEESTAPVRFAEVIPGPDGLPAARLVRSDKPGFWGAGAVRPFNIAPGGERDPDALEQQKGVLLREETADPLHRQYAGSGTIVDAGKNPQHVQQHEGQLDLVTVPLPKRENPDQPFSDIEDLMPDAAMVDDTPPTGVLGLSTGGLMGAIDFGLRRLYDLVEDNIKTFKAFMHPGARNQYEASSPCDRFLRLRGGDPMVGELTLREFTARMLAPFLIITRPLTTAKREENNPFVFVLKDKYTGRVKYVWPAALLSKHVQDIINKLGGKATAAFTGRDLLDALQSKPGGLTEEEQGLIDLLENQPDVHKSEYVAEQAVWGSFVAKKDFMDRLRVELDGLVKKYATERGGKDYRRVLRERGDLWNMEDMVYLAMFSSDRGGRESGFVRKLLSKWAMERAVSTDFLGEIYTTVRERIFQKQKMFAINIGEASQVLSFSDRVAERGEDGEVTAVERAGERNFQEIMAAVVNYNRRIRNEWRYWRRVLHFPTSRIVVDHSYVKGFRWLSWDAWYRESAIEGKTERYYFPLLRHWWRRNQIFIKALVNDTVYTPRPAVVVKSWLTAEEPVAFSGPLLASEMSKAVLHRNASGLNDALMLPGFLGSGLNAGEQRIGTGGWFTTPVQEVAAQGRVQRLQPPDIDSTFATPLAPSVTLDNAVERDPGVREALCGDDWNLSLDATANAKLQFLTRLFNALADVRNRDPRNYHG